ncbi:MAG: DUF362 domain-containing protein [Candidatus Omnitrophica bacterium]|nr:DUF362 domain-containing protein [Candidatus Omnitrophota bacterium]MBU1853866.1 DUF362 domain-containing protein [Candidatus Omnitrophota bacterium]
MKPKVSIVRCKTYESQELEISVRKAFQLLGGLSSFVKKGERVLLKPNILSGRLPEHGVNTHIEVVRVVANLVKECGATSLVGDNPGGSMGVKDVYESSGFLSLAKEEGVELKEVKNVKVIRGIPIASYFFECDKIISLPKMKTHSLTTLTGAVKNMYGAVAGLNKSHLHKRFPNPEQFANVLIDVFETVRPQLVLMDGIIAMDGDGPAAGTLKDVGLLIASQDSVAVDSVFSYLVGINPLDIPTTKGAYRRGLGEARIENIEVMGKSLEESFVRGFKVPGSRLIMSLPGPFVKILAALVKFGPWIDTKLCKKCKVCAETCPASAVTINEKESAINYRKCIRCMCCHEVCPYKAVVLKRNLFAKALGL